MSRFVSVAVVMTMLLWGQSAQADPLLNVIGGQLVGASGVNVGGSLFDVEFLDGTCVDVFTGCNQIGDFTFQTEATATLASTALLGQVFLDGALGNFNSDPELTAGCSFTGLCLAITPYYFPAAGEVGGVAAGKDNPPAPNFLFAMALPVTDDLTISTRDTWARWTPISVPEPSTLLLLGSGLVGLGLRRRR